jgi:neutral ceramidase
MMGYSLPEQRTRGIHMRLRSRAFVFAEPGPGKRVAIVIAELGHVFQAVKQEVARQLRADPVLGAFYDEKNVLISATHTHSGPGGYSHYDLYNLSVLGFVEQNFTVITSGIVESIRRAHAGLTPGRILINRGRLEDCGWNASEEAYERNPAEERDAWGESTDRTMTLLRLETTEGGPLGMLNWFPVHPTNLGNTIRIISGDNKGLAAYLFEKEMGTDYSAPDTFAGAFAQSNAGDVSPSLFWGYPDGIHDFERMEILGGRQYEKARDLFQGAVVPLRGGIDYRHTYVDFSRAHLEPEWIQDGDTAVDTCHAAIGVSMLAGSTEDSVGLPFIPEGVTCGGETGDCIPIVPEDQPCHREKYVILSLGRRTPVPWTPEILPVQVLKIGNLAVIGQPTEISTMSGRRLRNTVREALAGTGVEHAVIASLSNAYAGYVVTREEYASQQYEGASTHFGPYTLNAFQKSFHTAAAALARGEDLPPGPTPRDLTSHQTPSPFPGVRYDETPPGTEFGEVLQQPLPVARHGETVTAVFRGAHPGNDLKTQSSYLFVERQREDGTWTGVALDGDPETRFYWDREGRAGSWISITWEIPAGAEPGAYRIRHEGHWKSSETEEIAPYSGMTDPFRVP